MPAVPAALCRVQGWSLPGKRRLRRSECYVTVRRYVDLYDAGELDALSRVYADLARFTQYVEQWRGARWQKMALKIFKLPNGEGGLRKPYLMPPDDEVERFAAGLLKLRLTEVDELARAAGLYQGELVQASQRV